MPKSIRARIALSYLVICTAILIASAAAVYAVLRASLYRNLDDGLNSCIDVISLSLGHEIEEHGGKAQGEDSFRGIIGSVHQRGFPHQTILIFDGDGLIASKEGDAQLSAPPSMAPAGSHTVFATALSNSSARVRVAEKIVQIPQARTAYRFIVWQPVRPVELTLATVRWALIILVPLAIALCGVGGYFLVRESLRPVVRMAEAVDQLNARSLSGHLPVLESNDELGHLSATFNRLLSRLNKSFEQQWQFMADASHELKTPLSIAGVTTQVMLQMDRSGSEYREALTVVRNQLDRVSRIVHDMFLLARADAGGYQVRKRHCDLSEIVLEASKSAAPLARQRGIVIEPSEICDAPIEADPASLQQLILILLDNAIKYSGQGTRIEMKLENGGPTYRLTVRDHGPGIPQEIADRIFDRFFRVEQARSDSAGSGAGLGLAIARRIAALHGGGVRLADTGPQGSTFEVTLPA